MRLLPSPLCRHQLQGEITVFKCFFSLQGKALKSLPLFTTSLLVTLSPSTVCTRRSATLRKRRGDLKPKTS